MKKKILFLSPLPPPHYGASLLSEKCLDILKKSEKFKIQNIKLNYSKNMRDIGTINIDKILGIFNVKKKIIYELKNFKPDFVYFAPATSGLGLIRDNFFVQIIKKKNIPILFHIHSRVNSKKHSDVKRLKAMFSGEKVIVLGKELIKDVSWILPKEKITILPNAITNAITEKEFNQIIKKRGQKKIPNILFLSNMTESKGWFKLLKACKILKNKKINFKCNFVGAWQSNQEKKKFFNYVSQNKLQNSANYLGKKIGKEKNKVFASSDIFVFPTEYPLETFGLVLLEAMMFGLPIIANNTATIPSTISHNKIGFVLEKNTPEVIANYLEKLIKDKQLRIQMGEKGRQKFLEKFEIKNYERNLIQIIRSL